MDNFSVEVKHNDVVSKNVITPSEIAEGALAVLDVLSTVPAALSTERSVMSLEDKAQIFDRVIGAIPSRMRDGISSICHTSKLDRYVNIVRMAIPLLMLLDSRSSSR